jgi:hypothetical protein|nr:MAG TPA: rhamnogalacturonase A [Caudoviricetes sp.]
MDLNTIKNTGNWGSSSSRLNENFSKVGLEVDKLKYAAYNSKLYPSAAALRSAIPSPKVGDWAIVGDTIPGEIYQCTTDGVWTATGKTGGGYGMEVTEKHVTEQYLTEVHNEYTGDIVNNPDDEDLVAVEKAEGANVLKLADKVYNPTTFSGIGRIYLRKNMKGGKNVLDNTVIPPIKENTKFIIQYDYDLNGATLTIPEGCILDFQGGSISNGTLVGNNTKIAAGLLRAFGTSVTFSGTWDIDSVHPEWFGLKLNDASYDNHDALFASLRLSFKASRTKIVLPAGVIYTTPLILQEFGIHEIGDDGYWSKEGGFYIQGSTGTAHHVFGAPQWGTTLKALPSSNNYCLLQLCSEKNMKSSIWDTWSCSNCVIENVSLHCDKKCLHGINGNLNIYLSKVSVTSAISDGIVMEDYSYPFVLRDCYSVSNGGNGLFIKGPMSTVVLVENCEFAKNEGYGMYIEGCAFCNFNNVLVQGNKRGGVKIIKDMVKYASRPGSYFLQNLTFYNLYCEANGTLSTSDSNYEGNYNLYVTANPISELSYNKPNSITVNGGMIGSIQISNVYGFTLDNGCNFSRINVDKVGLRCVGVINKDTGNYVGSSSITKDLMPSYYTNYNGNNRVPFLVQRGGFTQERGRTHKYLFKYENISAGQSKYMKTDLASNDGYQFFLLPAKGSIKSISLYKRFWKGAVGTTLQSTFSGTITAEIYVSTIYSGTIGGTPIASVVLNHTTINYVQTLFKFLEKEFSTDATYKGMYLAVRLVASSDWNTGQIMTDGTKDSLIYCIVEVEEAQTVDAGV